MSGYFDAHVHSNLSDGLYSPEELCKMAVNKNIGVLVITDHNTCLSDKELSNLRGKFLQLELPRGCEFSCAYKVNGELKQIHLGGISFRVTDEINNVLTYNQQGYPAYVKKILAKLKYECGFDVGTYEELRASYKAKTLGRKQIAEKLRDNGYCTDIEEAFQKYLKKGCPAYVSNAEHLSSLEDTVRAIANAGGIVSICHLFQYNLTDEQNKALIKTVKSIAGELTAIEVYYTKYDDRQQNELLAYAKEFGLALSAGSDFHGDPESPVKSLGQFPKDLYTKMQERIRRHYDKV
ncbi:MAG: PHP domain-containing protein [Ruminococcus sp.]|nr:PHP domain-containing protein [Ruminococcus sp.]